MHCTCASREMGADGYLQLRGCLELPITLGAKPIAYKYVVCRNEAAPAMEYIKPTSHPHSKAVNRVLEVPKRCKELLESRLEGFGFFSRL